MRFSPTRFSGIPPGSELDQLREIRRFSRRSSPSPPPINFPRFVLLLPWPSVRKSTIVTLLLANSPTYSLSLSLSLFERRVELTVAREMRDSLVSRKYGSLRDDISEPGN